MKFGEKWLRQWVNPKVEIRELSEALTMSGLEVEAVEPIGDGLDSVFVGEVLTAEPHPNADRLRICTVDVGADEPLAIVCGAANVRAGLRVAVATVGAVLPGNFKIKQANIRGLASSGMICSSSELALADTSEGILELPHDAPVGLPFANYLTLPDNIVDVSLTPNRGDCLSIQGMAREVSAIFDTPLAPVEIQESSSEIDDVLPIVLQAPSRCPRYTGRVIRGINANAITPLWMTECLRRSGIRSIHPIVDIANYVMLELGQPMHAFDLKTLSGGIFVRESKIDEQVTLLDEQKITLDVPTLVIADERQGLAMAGIMGCASSAVSDQTTDIFLESAFFMPETISQSIRHYTIQSDSSHRFERGVDPDLTVVAMHRATQLILAIAGGKVGPVIDVRDEQYFPTRQVIQLRKNRIKRILGIALDEHVVEHILSHRLNMHVQKNEEGWQVTVPSYRFDLKLEVDLIEELARIHGYHQIPKHQMMASLTMAPSPEGQLTEKRLRDLLVDRGYYESINYSFVQPELSKLLSPECVAIPLSNPISADLSVMRTSLWPGLIQAARFNLHRQQTRLKLFEIGVCFLKEGNVLAQPTLLAGIALGSVSDEQWASPKRFVDFFDVKADVEAFLALTGNLEAFTFSAGTHPALHPGRSSDIQKKGRIIGHIGALHPQLQQQLDLQTTPYLFEIIFSELRDAMLPKYEAPSKYPSIRRDLAFIVEKKLPYQKIRDIIRASAGNTLKNLQLFDVYEGEGIHEGQKSVALGVTFQSNSRTLTDKEIDQAISNIITTLNQEVKAILRE
ncbi:MAG: phenylalanyl-tRNA synthetase [Gammaproteobacteria bacterium]|jgi:phenylalanyl-tRNA synthetase beta chain|nr:phenylalanyl-tRNA synthetase [Gammaproteobacteria bacterium]